MLNDGSSITSQQGRLSNPANKEIHQFNNGKQFFQTKGAAIKSQCFIMLEFVALETVYSLRRIPALNREMTSRPGQP